MLVGRSLHMSQDSDLCVCSHDAFPFGGRGCCSGSVQEDKGFSNYTSCFHHCSSSHGHTHTLSLSLSLSLSLLLDHRELVADIPNENRVLCNNTVVKMETFRINARLCSNPRPVVRFHS